MTPQPSQQPPPLRRVRCAIYTRKSSEEGLEMEFNSLDAQRESCEAYILSQRQEGWFALPDRFDDGGFSGGTIERPALKRLLQAVERRAIDVIVVYKLDRLTRSLLDFTKIIQRFEEHNVTFISITQQFNTTTSMGRLTLNMLLSFAQFEREIIGERIRDKVAASKKKGMYLGGVPILGYDVDREKKKLIVNEAEAREVRRIFARFLELGSATLLVRELRESGSRTKAWTTKKGDTRGGEMWNKAHIYRLINNPIYVGEVTHKGTHYPGEHSAIVDREVWDKIQAILSSNYRIRADQTRHSSHAMLKGLLRCGCCHGAMSPTFTKRHERTYRYYHCIKASKRGSETCDTGWIAAGILEDAVMEQLRAVFASPEIIARTWREVDRQRGVMLADVESDLHQVEHEQTFASDRAEELLAMQRCGGLGKTAAKELEETNLGLASLEERHKRLTQEFQDLHNARLTERDAAVALGEVVPVWDMLFPQEKTRLVVLLVEGATVHSTGIEVRLRAGGLHTLVSELR